MAEVHPISLDDVARHFEELEDPRSSVNRLHPLVSVHCHRTDGGAGRCRRADRDCQVGGNERRVSPGSARLAERDTAQGRLSPRPGTHQAKRLSSLFCELAAIAARNGRGGDWRDATDLRRRWQDSAAEPRSSQGSGRIAFGQRLGQRVLDCRWGKWPAPRNRTKSRRFPSF